MGRAGLLYAELSRADALARHLAHPAAMGKSSAALRQHHIGSSHGRKAPAPAAHGGPHPLGHRSWAWTGIQLRAVPACLGNPRHAPGDGQGSADELGDGNAVTIELAGRGLGPAGSVQVSDDLWAQWADTHFERAGEAAPTAPESSCPKVAALLRRLHADGLVDKSLLSNARAFVKYQTLAKCALIIDKQAFNHAY